MSLLSSNKPYAPIAPDIQRKLQDAGNRLRPLEASLSGLALEAELGVAGAAGRLSKVQEQIAAEKAAMAKLRLAHGAAVERDQDAERTQRAALRKAQVAALRKHLDSRDAAGEALTAALAEAVKHFKVVVERSKKAGDIAPIGDRLPDGAITEFADLKLLVAQEIYRLDGGDSMTGSLRSFPGAAVLDLNHQGNVSAIPALADRLKGNSAFIMQAITGRTD